MAVDVDVITASVKEANVKLASTKREIARVIVGQEKLIDSLLIALLTDGHLLIEGVPGLAKTMAVNALAKATTCDFKRIQFTPDLLPADLIGTAIYNPRDGAFTVKPGPIFTNIVLADEINRAPAKVQSALLEVMQERQVTIGGETFKVPPPYLVVATQNPIELEGTYRLPEAETDRFLLKVKIDYPTVEQEKEIVARWGHVGLVPNIKPVISPADILAAREVVNSIYVDPKIIDYILAIVFATRFPKNYGVDATGLLDFGASPRASLALKIAAQAHAFLLGRGYVTPHDIKDLVHEALRHRLRLSYEAEAQELTTDDIIDRILLAIPVP